MPTFKSSGKRSSYGISNWNSGRSTGYSSWTSGRSTGSSWTSGRSSTTNTTTWSPNSPQFTPIKNECQARICSYKNIYSQFSGTGKTCFSPSNANKWLKLINNGTLVYKFSNPQFVQTFGRNVSNLTPNAITRLFQQRFGQGVKNVTRGNNNCWLVAANPNVTATPFRNYSWK